MRAMGQENALWLQSVLLEVLSETIKLLDCSSQKSHTSLFQFYHQIIQLLDERCHPCVGRDDFLDLFELKTLHLSVFNDQERE